MMGAPGTVVIGWMQLRFRPHVPYKWSASIFPTTSKPVWQEHSPGSVSGWGWGQEQW